LRILFLKIFTVNKFDFLFVSFLFCVGVDVGVNCSFISCTGNDWVSLSVDNFNPDWSLNDRVRLSICCCWLLRSLSTPLIVWLLKDWIGGERIGGGCWWS